MELSPDKKIDIFKSELSLIFNAGIRSFTEVCVMMAPDYIFYNAPASTSGKYHPIDELSGYGTVIHTKRVVTVAYELSRGLGCEQNRDQVISACILHDLRKQGVEPSGHTVKWHPDLGAKLVEEIYNDLKLISVSDFEMIRNCVGYHYGPWSIKPWSKNLNDYTAEEMCVYLSDYIASKKSLTVKQEDRFDG